MYQNTWKLLDMLLLTIYVSRWTTVERVYGIIILILNSMYQNLLLEGLTVSS